MKPTQFRLCHTQLGFIQLTLMGWIAVAAGALILFLSIAVKVQTVRLESVKSEYATFKAQVKAVGDEQERKTKAQILADQKRKEAADAENKSSRDRIATLSRQLRDARANRSFLPAPAPGSPSPERATLDRAEFERAIQQLDSEVSGIVAKGDQAITDLDTAKRWADIR